jgi:hypothetical protein
MKMPLLPNQLEAFRKRTSLKREMTASMKDLKDRAHSLALIKKIFRAAFP